MPQSRSDDELLTGHSETFNTWQLTEGNSFIVFTLTRIECIFLQVAYAWAVSLGGEAGAKLLTKFGLIEQAIDYATESGAFDQAFQLSRTSMKSKLPDVHLKHAMFLEDEGRFKEAEEEFINAKKPKEAIDMYTHQKDWDNALRIADNYDPSSRGDVMLAKARSFVEKKDMRGAESLFIEAGKPDMAVKAYKDARMWDDAIRVAKAHEKHLGSVMSPANLNPESFDTRTQQDALLFLDILLLLPVI